MTDKTTEANDLVERPESDANNTKDNATKPIAKRNYRNLAILGSIIALGIILLLVLFAVLKPFGVKVMFDADGGNEVAPIMVKRGERPELPTSTKDGYVFDGWYLGDDKVVDLSALAQSVTLKAHWRKAVANSSKTFTVSFDSRGGSAVTSITLKEGQTLTLPANPTMNGKTFDKWVDKNDMPILDGALLAPEDVTLYAVWIDASQATSNKPNQSNKPNSSTQSGKVHTCPSGYAMAGAKCAKSVAPQYVCEGNNVFAYGDKCVKINGIVRKDTTKVCPTKTVHMGYGYTPTVQGELVNWGNWYCYYGHIASITDQSTCTAQSRKWAGPVSKCFVERDQNYTSSCDASYALISNPNSYAGVNGLNGGCFPLLNKTAKCNAPYTLTGTQCVHTVEPTLQ